MVRRSGYDAVLEDISGREAQDADGFDADVLVRGKVGDNGVGLVGDGAGEDIGGAAAGVGDVDDGDFDLLEGAVEVEIQVRELADAEFAVDADAGVDLFAGVAIGLEADVRFQQFDLGGGFGDRGFIGGFAGRGSLLGTVRRLDEQQG